MELSIVTKTFGPWQHRIFVALCYFNVVSVWQNYGIVFLSIDPVYRCVEPPEGVTQNATCQVFVNGSTVPCTRWEYEGPSTIISEWDLVCDREWLVSLSKSVYMFGYLISVSVFGQLSDIFGRFPTSLAGFVLNTVAMFATLLSSSYSMFLAFRFLQALGRMGYQIITFVLMLEITGVRNRSAVGLGFQCAWAFGACILPGVAWIFQDWFWLQLVMSLVFLPFALAYVFRIIPESPRWLLMKGRHEELRKTLNKVATLNNLELDVEQLETLEMKTEVDKEIKMNKKSETIIDLLKTPKLRKNILILYYLWAVVAFMFYALLFNTGSLSGSLHLNFFAGAVLEFLSYFAIYWGIRVFGRRPTLIFTLFGICVICVARVLLPQDYFWLQIFLWMSSRFLTSGAFGTLYLYSGELFPTVVRNVAVGSCSTAARVGAMIAPFVKELGKATNDWVPTVLYGSLCLAGGCLAFLLPETKDKEMTDALEEEEGERTAPESDRWDVPMSKILSFRRTKL